MPGRVEVERVRSEPVVMKEAERARPLAAETSAGLGDWWDIVVDMSLFVIKWTEAYKKYLALEAAGLQCDI